MRLLSRRNPVASLRKYIEDLQAFEAQHPGTEVLFGTVDGECAFSDYQIAQRRVTKKEYRGGVRFVSNRAKTAALVVEPRRK
jgi:hypothetical protein